MLNEKELNVYKTIQKFIKNNNYSPSIRELCSILNYKSTKTIYRYLQKLREKKYLTYNTKKKRSIIINNDIQRHILVINTKEVIEFNLDNTTIIFQIKNNYFKDLLIKKNDYLIINTQSKIKNNDLGLFIINKEYRIMKYNYIDGFYILKDKEEEILSRIDLVGKVIGFYRKNI